MKNRLATLGLVLGLATFMTMFFTQPLKADQVPLPVSGPVNGFTGAVNATTGHAALTAVTACPPNEPCIPASPATWTITSTLGWPPIQQPNPSTTFTFQIPVVGFQTIGIKACNPTCFTQVKKIGWLDSEIELFGLNNPIHPNTAYQMWFTATTTVASPEYVTIYLHFLVDVNYVGSAPMQLILQNGAVVSCGSIPQGQNRTKLDCQTLVSSGTTVTGYVLVPAGHGQVAFSTGWEVSHTYFQPGPEAEFPWDSHNTAFGRYGRGIYLPFLNRS